MSTNQIVYGLITKIYTTRVSICAGIYRTTYKGKQFLRTYNYAVSLLSNSEKEIK
jgi:hypothetical protein